MDNFLMHGFIVFENRYSPDAGGSHLWCLDLRAMKRSLSFGTPVYFCNNKAINVRGNARSFIGSIDRFWDSHSFSRFCQRSSQFFFLFCLAGLAFLAKGFSLDFVTKLKVDLLSLKLRLKRYWKAIFSS